MILGVVAGVRESGVREHLHDVLDVQYGVQACSKSMVGTGVNGWQRPMRVARHQKPVRVAHSTQPNHNAKRL